MTRIDVMKPWMGPEEVAAAAAAIESGWVAQGPRVAEFESRFAELVGAPHAVAVSSCTAALHLALVATGVGPGDEVVVPSFSFIATANAPTYVGATPVFADVDPITGNLTPQTVEPLLTAATRAVILVHQAGVPADADAMRALCNGRGIVVVEDSACAAGSTWGGRPVSADAEVAAWSFHPRKLVTTGEGGMVTTSDPTWAARIRRLREHGMSVSAADRHRSVLAPAEEYGEVGFNYRMTDVQAAIGIVQLGRLPAVVARRREIAAGYRAALAGVPGLRPVTDPPGGTSNVQSFWVEVGDEFPLDREALLAHLAEHEISARRGIMAAHRQPAHADRTSVPLPVTERLTDTTLILPVHHALTDVDQARVVEALRSAAALVAA